VGILYSSDYDLHARSGFAWEVLSRATKCSLCVVTNWRLSPLPSLRTRSGVRTPLFPFAKMCMVDMLGMPMLATILAAATQRNTSLQCTVTHAVRIRTRYVSFSKKQQTSTPHLHLARSHTQSMSKPRRGGHGRLSVYRSCPHPCQNEHPPFPAPEAAPVRHSRAGAMLCYSAHRQLQVAHPLFSFLFTLDTTFSSITLCSGSYVGNSRVQSSASLLQAG